MAQREVILDQPVLGEHEEDLRQANERAERAEVELAKLKQKVNNGPSTMVAHEGEARRSSDTSPKAASSPSSEVMAERPTARHANVSNEGESGRGGEEELRKDSMMAHLLDSLAAGKDIGHYGRLVFAMVARHFMEHKVVLRWMMMDPDVDEQKATLMLRQVEGKDYNPPRRDKILSYQAQQEFPILPNPDDPDCGNLYRNLKFPNQIYEHIGHYQEAKLESGE